MENPLIPDGMHRQAVIFSLFSGQSSVLRLNIVEFQR